MSQGNDGSAQPARTVRELVEEALREFGRSGTLNVWQEGKYNTGGLTQKVHQLAQKHNVPTNDGTFWAAVVEHIWSLARIGALALMPKEEQLGPVVDEQRMVPSFVITELGHRLLAEPSYSPHDWATYKTATLLRVTAPDDVVVAHLEEAVRARQGALYRASLVMLGCACERLILLLADAVRDAAISPYSAKLKTMLSSPKPVGIALVFKEVRGALLEGANLSHKLHDSIDC